MRRSFAPTILLSCFLSLAMVPALAQVHSITTPSITTCAGVLYDSGGSGGSGYGPNQTYTSTICPSTPGQSMSLNFIVFSLDTTLVDDQLSIYDGANMNAPLMGSFTWNALQGLVVVASASNATGCLTLRFTSNAVGNGVFAATVACTGPCPAPLASFFTSEGDTARMCPGELLSVDGSASIAAPGRTIAQWKWVQTGFGAQTTTTPVAAIDVIDGGISILNLQVVDNLGCPSPLAGSTPVLVAPRPSFGIANAPTVACLGSELVLSADPVAGSFVLDNSSCVLQATPTFLPDDVGLPIEFPIQIVAADAGAILTDADQLGEICVDMEHSFMGDMIISLTCPNGSSVNLHQQGGGGTYLGAANDIDNNQSPIPGDCWTYCWSASATNGTWVDNSIGGNANTTLAGTPPNQALNPGTYEPVQSLDGLLGCPLSGTWKLTFVDLWGADNGAVCGWCMGIAIDTDTALVDLAPSLGTNSADSSFWSGPNVVNDATDVTAATAIATTTGGLTYTYSITDSYGCVHNAIVPVEVVEVPVVNAGPDLSYCADPVLIEAEVQGGIGEFTCTWTLRLMDSALDSWNGGAHLDVTIGGVMTTYTVPSGVAMVEHELEVSVGQSVVLEYTAGTIWNGENRLELMDSEGNILLSSPNGPPTSILYAGTAYCGSGPGPVSWTPSQGLLDPNSVTPLAAPAMDTEYTLTVTVPGPAGCSASDVVLVTTQGAAPFGLDYDEGTDLLCADQSGFVQYAWYMNGALVTATTDPCYTTSTFGAWTVLGVDDQGCAAHADTVLICPTITLEQNAGVLVTQAGYASYAWTLESVAIPGAVGPFLEIDGNGLYTVTVTTTYGCVMIEEIFATGITSIADLLDPTPSFSVFPVPNDGSFTVLVQHAEGRTGQLRMLNMTGRIVHAQEQRSLSDRTTITVDVDVAPGAYFIQLDLGAGILVQRIVVR